MEITGALKVVAKNGKGFKIEGTEEWLNANDESAKVLATLAKNDEITVTYEKKDGSNKVTQIVKKYQKAVEAPKVETSTGFTCIVCGKELKDGKYKKCFMCNKKSPEAPVAKTESKPNTTYYDNPSKTAQKSHLK